MAKSSSGYDFFYVYDSAIGSRVAEIKAHNMDSVQTYFITAEGISLEFPDDYIPDVYSGYLYISNTSVMQQGSIKVACNGFKSQSGILLPLYEPAGKYPKCNVYNRIILAPEDTLRVSFVDGKGEEVATTRINVTLHFTKSLEFLK